MGSRRPCPSNTGRLPIPATIRGLWFLPSALLMLFAITSPASSQCLPTPPGPGFHYGGMKYVLTPHAYDAVPNLPEEIRAEYGGSAQIADWQTLKGVLSNPADLQDFIAEAGIPFQEAGGPCNNIFVSNAGSMQLEGGITFFARHDGLDESAYYLTFETIGNHTLDLGRWTHRSQALIAIPEDEERSKQGVFDISRFSNQTFDGLMCLLVAACLLIGGKPRRSRLA